MTGCVTERLFAGTGFRPAPATQYAAFLPATEPVILRDADRTRGVALAVRYDYIVEDVGTDTAGREFRIRETSYRFQVSDRDGREILAYHWHPEGVSPVTEPHLHLSGRLRPLDAGERDAPVALGEMHLPTGQVTLTQVVRLLITGFGVEPRRPDWETILGRGAGP